MSFPDLLVAVAQEAMADARGIYKVEPTLVLCCLPSTGERAGHLELPDPDLMHSWYIHSTQRLHSI